MDKLKEMLESDPCYEQHIVSIKDIYEEFLFSILIPAIYEGFQSLYKRSHEIEEKYIIACKKNPNILTIFQTLIKDIPNLTTHKIRNETDRIKSSTKSADIFDDLIKAVVKANIILLTYNIDHKRINLLQTKFHENIIIYDFIHACYVQGARIFYGCSELFYHKMEPIALNQNKRTCYKIIKDAMKEAIRLMLPMKEILLEYITQPYEQKERNKFNIGENPYNNPHNHSHSHHGVSGNQTGGNNDENEYINIAQMVNRDLRGDNFTMLVDEYDENNKDDMKNSFENGLEITRSNHSENENDFSLLVDSDNISDGINKSIEEHNIIDIEKNNDKNDAKDNVKDDVQDENKDKDKDKQYAVGVNLSHSDPGVKMIDISGVMSKKGAASSYFQEVMPDIKKQYDETKKMRKSKKESTSKESKDRKESSEHKEENSSNHHKSSKNSSEDPRKKSKENSRKKSKESPTNEKKRSGDTPSPKNVHGILSTKDSNNKTENIVNNILR
jgi:hypothetical protein